MDCGDQLLRNFLNGLVIHLRGTKEDPKNPKEVLDQIAKNKAPLYKEKIDPADFIIKNKDSNIEEMLEKESFDGIEFKIDNCKDSDEFIEFFMKCNFSETVSEKYMKYASKKFDVNLSTIKKQLKVTTVTFSPVLSETDDYIHTSYKIFEELNDDGYTFFRYQNSDKKNIVKMLSQNGKSYDVSTPRIS